MILPRRASILVRPAVVWLFAAHGVSAQRAVLAGTVVDKLARVPLPYSGVSIVGKSDERLTGDGGTFRFDVEPGVVRLRIRHVGFTPVDTQVRVVVRDTTRLTVELTRIPVTLAAVRVTDEPCRLPGAPSGGGDALPQVFEQLQLNAEQFRLVNSRYAFRSIVERRFSRLAEQPFRRLQGERTIEAKDTITVVTSVDSISIPSEQRWHYKPGEIIVPTGRSGFSVNYAVRIPTLAVFADPEFVKAHCFRDGGVVDVDGQSYRRVDFRAAESVHDPDIDGTMYLDPETFVIRRSRIRLSRSSDKTRDFDSVAVETAFEELVPGVPLIVRSYGRNSLKADAGDVPRGFHLPDGSRILANDEFQRVREIRFTNDVPDASDSSSRGHPARREIGVDASGHRRVLGVFDRESGAPVVGATVRDSASGRSAVTDTTGTVRLGFVPGVTGVIRVEHAGFEPTTLPVSLTLLDGNPITLVLNRVRAPR